MYNAAMLKVTPFEQGAGSCVDPALLEGKRHLMPDEIAVLVAQGNTCSDEAWESFFVSDTPGEFDPKCIWHSDFAGFIVLGAMRGAWLSFHDLRLKVGISRSHLCDVVVGDDCAICNVKYLVNYRLGSRVMLFNIQEMSCTLHSKFGEGILKQGESEKDRIWVEAANENAGRAVLAFREMIAADAFLWSRFREDEELMRRFVELTEWGKSKALDTYGTVGCDAVVKNSVLIKDAMIGECAYIKGAMKLKNVSILSSEDERTQIGEGVEMVNGILGYGSRVFYQAIAVRFVIGRNCQLKYGARLLNSVLGDNSTVSCCELLNNLIFPFHEQHHNSSFLIASTVMGQSNIASAATIGSNHNSRKPDCEMIAGRGFWPGLCSDFKFDSRFASFVLVAKGSYMNELNITYPFSLVAPGDNGAVRIIPAYWFLHNMFAIVRNKYKFAARDKRVVKVQHIETNPLAPDTVQEILIALDRIVELTSRYLKLPSDDCRRMTKTNPNPALLDECREAAVCAQNEGELLAIAKSYLMRNPDTKFYLTDDRCQKKKGALVCKGAQGFREYRRVLKYFAAECLMDYVLEQNRESLCHEDFEQINSIPLYEQWMNVGGQVIPRPKVDELFQLIKAGQIQNWTQVHAFYDECQRNYCYWKARYACRVVELLCGKPMKEFNAGDFEDFSRDVALVSFNMFEASLQAREKDFSDFFRSTTYRSEEEKAAVIGTLKGDDFLKMLSEATEDFTASLDKLFTFVK